MAQKRARLSDNDPLTATDAVLAGFEILSKSGSQQVNQSTSQEVEETDTGEIESNEPHLNPSASQEVNQSTNQPDSNPKEPVRKKQASPSGSQQVDKSKLKKATFQLSEAVLEALDRFHLKLQLDLGKASTPYKEVMVEEAIVQWLAQAEKTPEKVLKGVQKRQSERV